MVVYSRDMRRGGWLLMAGIAIACGPSDQGAPPESVDAGGSGGSSVGGSPPDGAGPRLPPLRGHVPSPWPPDELTAGPSDPQPTGVGWRSAQWNVCTTSMDDARLECRARIAPTDEGRTAVLLERAAIAKYFTEDENMYSFTLQEVCEQDARWIAAFVALGGPPANGWDRDFSAEEYTAIDDTAPYAFLPYLTHEMMGDSDYGCGVGISTGIATIAKRTSRTTGLSLRGLTNASYPERATTGLRAVDLQDPSICALYFEYQTSYAPIDPNDPDSAYLGVSDFRSSGCTSTIPVTLRGTACVRTRWLGPGDDTTYRVSTCATHAVHKGKPTFVVRNHQIDEAGWHLFDFAGGAGQRSLLSGDFNVVADRGEGATLDEAEKGHTTILTDPAHGFGKLSIGDHDTSDGTGTHRGNCGREIDAIYGRNAWWLMSASPNPSICRDLPRACLLYTSPSSRD